MGTPVFAARSLERLYADGHDIAGVFTQPDRAGNRGMRVNFSPVKETALAHNTPVHQPATLKDGAAAELLRKIDCELIAVVAYGKLLTKEILDIPPLGAVNIHGSLLPKYRGAAPIQWAVMRGEKETGITSMYMAEEMDAGDMILAAKVRIGDDETAGQLHDRLSILGADVLSDTVKAISEGTVARIPQDHSKATYAPMLKNEICPIDWNETAHDIVNKVRGLNPKPAATMEYEGETIKVYAAEPGELKSSTLKPGQIVSRGNHGIEVSCAGGTVRIVELQAPGSKKMAAADFLRGRRIK